MYNRIYIIYLYIECPHSGVIGNQVRILNDPVTVIGELQYNMPLRKARRRIAVSEPLVRKPAQYIIHWYLPQKVTNPYPCF